MSTIIHEIMKEISYLRQQEMELRGISQDYYNLYFGKECFTLIMSMHSPIPDAATNPDQFFEPVAERIKKFDSILEVPDICLIPPSIEKMLELHPAQDDAYV
jgi:hypothetical protein